MNYIWCFLLSLALTYLHPQNRLQSNGKTIAKKRASSSSQIYGDPLPGRPICTEPTTESMLIFFSVHLNRRMKKLVKQPCGLVKVWHFLKSFTSQCGFNINTKSA